MDARTKDRQPTAVVASDDAPTSRPGSTRTARLGLLVMAAAPFVAALGDPSVLAFIAPIIVLAAIGAFLVSRFGRWAHAVAAVLGLLGLVVALPGAWVYGEVPDSFFDVAPTTMFLLGGLLAVVGGVACTVTSWRGASLAGLRTAALGLGALVAAGSAVLAVTTSSDVDAAALTAATQVSVDERGYDPETLALPTGETVALAIRNDGRIAHGFTSEALGVDVMLSPGEVVLAEVFVPDDVAGLQFWCAPHSQVADDGRREWMVGELVADG